MASRDTTAEIEAMQLEIRRSMSGDQRLRVCLEMSVFARELRKAGIRRDHPDWSDKEVMMELFRLAFFPEPLRSGYVLWLEDRFDLSKARPNDVYLPS